MSTILVVDRSLIVPHHLFELYEMRNLLVHEISAHLGPPLSTVITYSEVAREASLEEAMANGPDPVYGSNLQHALLMARGAARTTKSERILLLTYSLPSAHHTGGTDPFFMDPPIEESLDAARREAVSAVSDGLRLDILTAIPSADESRSSAIARYFGSMANAAGSTIRSISAGEDVEPVVRQLL